VVDVVLLGDRCEDECVDQAVDAPVAAAHRDRAVAVLRLRALEDQAAVCVSLGASEDVSYGISDRARHPDQKKQEEATAASSV
jgi:hypothetical protein